MAQERPTPVHQSFKDKLWSFTRTHRRNLAYGGAILGATAIASVVGNFWRTPSIPEGQRIVASSAGEFEIAYACVPNRSRDSFGTKHIEVFVTSPSFRSDADPATMLRIRWDESYADYFQSNPAYNPNSGSVPPREFQGSAKGSYELAFGFQRYPIDSKARVEILKEATHAPADKKLIYYQTTEVPRYC